MFATNIRTRRILLTTAYVLAVTAFPTWFYASSNAVATAGVHQLGKRGTVLGRTASNPCAVTQCMYVANSETDEVLAFPVSANGNTPPVAVLSGSQTGLIAPWATALDSEGNLYVANNDARAGITSYAAGANGNSRPVRRISGRRTKLHHPDGLALDQMNNIYVANWRHSDGKKGGSVRVFAHDADGNVSPIGSIIGAKTRIREPAGMSFDRRGHLYVANSSGGSDGHGSITAYDAGATGNVAPIQTIGGSNTGLIFPFGVAVAGNGDIFVTSSLSNSVNVFSAGATGNVTPIRVITGSSTKLVEPIGIALDSGGQVYVTNNNQSVTVYAGDANGNVAPIRLVSGKATRLSFPEGIAIH